MSGEAAVPENFNGTARLFPLPNVVLFPEVLLPLHIFEPRYRQMKADALAGDRLIAMALLRPGWEKEYEARPPLYPTVCLGRIVAHQQLDDGRSNLLLRGLSRARIVAELPPERLYRRAQLELFGDTGVPTEQAALGYRRKLTRLARPWLRTLGPASSQVPKLLTSDLPVGVLADLLAFALPLPVEFKQELLGEQDTGERIRRLLECLATRPASAAADTTGQAFPPEFSPN
jgi:uncharacterized protein